MKNGLFIDDISGIKIWFLNNKYHRIDGPAIECANGSKCWYQDGEHHRIDGPAIDYIDGYKEWWINGKKLKCHTQEEFTRLIKLDSFW